jgi:adenosine deaminase
LEDPELVARLASATNTNTGTKGIPITFCPCSNHRLQVIPRFFAGANPVRHFLNRGVLASINSDDPAYFFMGPVDAEGRAASESSYDGFISSNFMRTQRDCGLSPDELVILALNSFRSSFLESAELEAYAQMVADHCAMWNRFALEQTEQALLATG